MDQRDGIANAPRPFRPRQAHLGRRRARAAQHVRHRQSEVGGELGRLIEAAAPAAAPVERHGHDQVRPGQHVGARSTQEFREGTSQRAVSVVLERVEDRPQTALVGAGSPPLRPRRAVRRTGQERDAGRRRAAARRAGGPGQGLPAASADDAASGFRKGRRARGAGRRPDDGKHGVGQRAGGRPEVIRAPSRRGDTRCARRFPRAVPGRRSVASRR